MNSRRQVASGLADAFLTGTPTTADLIARGEAALGQQATWLPDLAIRIEATFNQRWRPEHRELSQFICQDPGFAEALSCPSDTPKIRRRFFPLQEMGAPLVPLAGCRLPQLPSSADLAEWLGLSCTELEWFSNPWSSSQYLPPGPLRHYVYRWVPKRRGGHRLLEIPKSRLRKIQRQILHEILNQLPPHEAAHGFRRGRSCLTYVLPHCNQAVVMRMDLRNFFTQVPAQRIRAIFSSLGYPQPVAQRLSDLCTNRTPRRELACPGVPYDQPPINWSQRKLYQQSHLPQGAPSSPALANLALYRLDLRLAQAASSLGANYTRYADDLAFSGGEQFARRANAFHLLVCRIALEEGFPVETRKTRIMRRGVRQRLTGILINRHPNPTRHEYDRLKAILHNCLRYGPSNQNREARPDFRAHLLGKLTYLESLNPARGGKLRAIWERIDWNR